MKKILDIPHTCQYNNSIPEEWHIRVCGLACVKMVLDYHHVDNDLLSLLNEGQSIGAYNPSIGWNHEGLVRLLRNHGVLAYSQEFKSVEIKESGEMVDSSNDNDFINKGFSKIKESIDSDKPVIASVGPGFGENEDSHLVLIVGYNESGIYINDPDNRSGEIKKAQLVSEKRFLEYWRKLCIFTG